MKNNFLGGSTITYTNGKVGCLLIHGFTGTPDELSELAEYLSSKEITVLVPLLSGHGTNPGELDRTTWKQWFADVRDAYHRLNESSDEIFVGGLSMGGTLALHLASHYPVQGIFTFAAPVLFDNPKIRYISLVKKFFKYYPKQGGPDIHNLEAKQKIRCYNQYPLRAVQQLQQLIRHTCDDLGEILAPILVIHSKQDHTIPYKNAELIINHVASKDKKIRFLENSYHVITMDYDKERIKRETFEFIYAHSKLLNHKGAKHQK